MADDIQPPEATAVPDSPPAEAAPLPPETVRFDRTDGVSLIVTALVAFAVYAFTLAPNVTLEFSGILSTGANYLGVPHPPGYPVWTIYSWCFTKLLPFSNIAWRVAVGSAVASAAACGLVALMVSFAGRILFDAQPSFSALNSRDQKLLRVAAGAVAGLVLAFTNAVWRTAVIVEMWAMSLLLFTGVLCLLTYWAMNRHRRGRLIAAFFLYGLLLTNSQEMIVALPALVVAVMLADEKLGRDACFLAMPLMILVTTGNHSNSIWTRFMVEFNWPMLGSIIAVTLAGIGLVVYTRRLGTEWKAALLCAFGFLLGLAFYFYNPIASTTNPPVNWGYPRTAEGFWHVIGRGQYERALPTHSMTAFVEQSGWLVQATGRNFGWICLALAAMPLALMRRFPPAGRRWLLGLIGMMLGTGFLELAQLNPPDYFRDLNYYQEHFAPFYAVLAVLLGLGLMMLAAKIVRPNGIVAPAQPSTWLSS